MEEIDEKDVLDAGALDDLYGWIDEVPLTRPKKNIARDFSDGVMVAEIVHHYLPRAVDIHNYVVASSSGQKRVNWITLNRKVFAKMDIKLNDATLSQIVDARPGAIEQVLWDLRKKILENAPRVETDAIITMTPSKSKISYSELAKGTPSSHYGCSQPIVPATPSTGRFHRRESNSGLQLSSARKIEVSNLGNVKSSSLLAKHRRPSTLPPLPKPLPNVRMNKSNICSDIAGGQKSSNPPGDSTDANHDSKSGQPPSQIVYRGHKMVPMECLELKDKEIKDLETGKKSLLLKIDRLEKLIDIKDQRIEDLAHQLYNVRTMYERVTQTTLIEGSDNTP